MELIINPPKSDEHNSYFGTYIAKAGSSDLMTLLNENLTNTEEFLIRHIGSNWNYKYQEGKWTAKDVIRHVIDCERIFANRALRIGRGDKTPLPGFEQDDFASAQNLSNAENEVLLDEFKAVRVSTIYLFNAFDMASLNQRGTANDSVLTPRAAGFIIVGHAIHHMEVLSKKYFS